MSVVFSADGTRSLLGAWILLAGCAIVGAGLVGASYWYRDTERRESNAYESRLREARSRLDAVRRERDSLQQSSETFRTLLDRGLLQNEQRLDLVELVNELRSRHRILALDYDVAPQRPLGLASGRAFPTVEVLASRVKLRIRALHEGDLLAFLDALAASRQGFYPLDRCTLRRLAVADETDATQPRVEGECSLEWVTLKEKRGGA